MNIPLENTKPNHATAIGSSNHGFENDSKNSNLNQIPVNVNSVTELTNNSSNSEQLVVNDDSTWITQVSTKRRLIPQFQLSSQNLGADSNRGKPNTSNASNQNTFSNNPGIDEKKKVIKYTKEDLLALRKSSVPYVHFSEFLEIVSLSSQEPVSREKLNVVAIWNNSYGNNDKVAGGKDGSQRSVAPTSAPNFGRGRGRTVKDNDTNPQSHVEEDNKDGWVRNQTIQGVNNQFKRPGMWDDEEDIRGNAKNMFDLSDFAAATQRFRAEMMKGLGIDVTDATATEDDTMESLLKEQVNKLAVKETVSSSSHANDTGITYEAEEDDDAGLKKVYDEDDDDDLPDWAMEDLDMTDDLQTSQQNHEPSTMEFESLLRSNYFDLQNLVVDPTGSLLKSGEPPKNQSVLQNQPIVPKETPVIPTNIGSTERRSLLLETLRVKPPATIPTQNISNVTAIDPQSHQVADFQYPQSTAPLLTSAATVKVAPYVDPRPVHSNLQSNLINQYSSNQILAQQLPNLVPQQQFNAIPTPQPSVPVAIEWYYTDPQSQIQGPFSQMSMRQWHEAGYFIRDLPIKMSHWKTFYPFRVVYPDERVAFLRLVMEPTISMPAVSLNANPPSVLTESNPRKPPSPVASQRNPPEVKIVERQDTQNVQQTLRSSEISHAPVDSMVKVNPITSSNVQTIPPVVPTHTSSGVKSDLVSSHPSVIHVESTHKMSTEDSIKEILRGISIDDIKAIVKKGKKTEAPVWGNTTAQPTTMTKISMRDIQRSAELEKNRQQNEKMLADQEMKEKNASPWKISGSGQGVSAVKLSNIVREEESSVKVSEESLPVGLNMSSQLKSLLGVKSGGSQTSSSNTNKAAWSSTIQSSNTAVGGELSSLRDIMKEEATAAQQVEQLEGKPSRLPNTWAAKAGTVGSSNPSTSMSNNGTAVIPARSVTAPNTSSEMKKLNSNSPNNNPSKGNATKLPGDNFGGKEMSKELSDWCGIQLQRLKGSSDLTLMRFCMSLDSATEIRETLSNYLGSSPQVTNFATEFIKLKDSNQKGGIPISSMLSSLSHDAQEGVSHVGSNGKGNGSSQNFVVASKKKKATGGATTPKRS